jgi:lipooligosaccharide transport system ATP-binding protein
MPEPVIRASGLTKVYGDFEAVKGIDFRVEPGECFGLLGPNGAGKTTTMNMVQGYSPLTGGTLEIFGMDVTIRAREIKARIGVVPQENNLDPDLTVIENLIVYARYFDIPRKLAIEKAEGLLRFIALTEKRNELVPMLSGGMKRRLMLARALINDPELVILDEPTTGLDPQARHLIWQKLRGLQKEGRTMAITTHYMDEAYQLCDRLVIMDNGRILDEGTPKGLLKKHVRGSVVELSLVDRTPEEIRECLSGTDCEFEQAGDTMFIYSDDAEEVLAKAACFTPSGFVHRQATLEDVFLKLTGRDLRE